MRHVGNILRQVALLAPRAHKMTSHSGGVKISACQRGAFILFEGGDRCGKTTQAQSLVDNLKASGVNTPTKGTLAQGTLQFAAAGSSIRRTAGEG